MTGFSTYPFIIAMNVNSLNSPIKKQKLVVWIKNNMQLFAAFKKHTSPAKCIQRLKLTRWKTKFLQMKPKIK